jgi:copper chaperone CopZ
MSNSVYHVTGMTCEHCVNAVTTEISKLEGVTQVNVNLVPGGRSSVHVGSRSALNEHDVREAIDEAGYELVDS